LGLRALAMWRRVEAFPELKKSRFPRPAPDVTSVGPEREKPATTPFHSMATGQARRGGQALRNRRSIESNARPEGANEREHGKTQQQPDQERK
jgi:hypothetical protein